MNVHESFRFKEDSALVNFIEILVYNKFDFTVRYAEDICETEVIVEINGDDTEAADIEREVLQEFADAAEVEMG